MEYCRRIAFAESGWAPDPRYALPGTKPRYAPDREFDTSHIRIQVDLDLEDRAFDGLCTTTLRAFRDGARQMVFDAVDFRLRSVRGPGGRPLRHTYDGSKLTVTLPRPLRAGEASRVQIAYRVVRPKLGMYFIAPDRRYPERPTQVWTQGQDEYSRYWFPCHDAPQEKATTELLATVPEGFFALSNGRLMARRRSAGTRRITYHWRMSVPHSPYLVTLAVGRFAELRDRWNGIPILYYCERGREADIRRAFGKTPKAMAFFSRATGIRYPYEKYAQVAVAEFIFGGMENTTATTQTDTVLHEERARPEAGEIATGLMAHELAHQWFGDLLTCTDWSHAWLNESFATYFDALFVQHDRGEDEFQMVMEANRQAYLEEDANRYRRPIVTNLWRDPGDLFDRHLYEKGACVLHMLRYMLGEDPFWRAIRHYVRAHQGHSVETGDLVASIQTATGKNLRRFFDQWIYRAGHPEYRVQYWWDPQAREANLVVAQTQKTGDETPLFSMPVEIDFDFGRVGKRSFRETVEERRHHFTYPLPREPLMVRFDPGHWILKKVEFTKPAPLWIYQLSHDDHVQGRVEAARALGKLGSAEAVAALGQAIIRERFWGVQVAIARTLGQLRNDGAMAALLRGVQAPHPKVRRAAVEALGEFRSIKALGAIRQVAERDRSYFVAAEALRTLGKTRDPAVRPVLEQALRARESWNDTVRIGAIDGLAALGDREAIARVRERTRYGNPHTSRMAAVRALGKAGRGQDEVLTLLLKLTGDRFLRVQLAAVHALGDLGDDRAVGALQRIADREKIDGRLRRAAAEAIRKIRGDEEAKPPPLRPAPRGRGGPARRGSRAGP